MAEIAREILPVNLEDEMRKSYLDYAMSVIVGPRAARRARRPEARAPARALRHARARQRLEHARTRNRRASSAMSSANIIRTATSPCTTPSCAWRSPSRCATCWSTARAISAPSTAIRRRPCATPKCACRKLGGRAARGHRQGNGRLHPELRRVGERAGGAAGARPEPADQRLLGHRGGHGDQHPAAQPRRRSSPRASRSSRIPTSRSRELMQIVPGPDFPTAGLINGAQEIVARLQDRPRPAARARAHAYRGRGQGRPAGDRHHRASLPGQQGEADRAHRRSGARQAHRGHRLGRVARRVRQGRHARRDRAEARRGAGDSAQQPVRADADGAGVRHQHGRAGRRPAAASQS